MEMRRLGSSGLQVSALGFGTMTFGGTEGIRSVGTTQVDEARRQIDLCLEAGINLFDSADGYSQGASEEILGQALQGRRDDVILATKVHSRMGPGPNDLGQSRHHIIRGCEASLKRLGTDYIDLYQVHGFDPLAPLEETLRALDDLVRAGKVRYIGCSNYSAWHLMKALSISERQGLERYVSQQVYYSLVARELENELVPLALDQGIGSLIWSPLSGGFLTGKFRRGQDSPQEARRVQRGDPGTIDEDRGYAIVDVLEEVAQAHNASIAQAALNWLLQKPGVTSVLIGARREEQLMDNLKAASWTMRPEEVQRLDEVSATPPIYPYWHQQRNNARFSRPAAPGATTG
jgi:aryl-alcohol dehydrogenase-like predicted oxidoreductase